MIFLPSPVLLLENCSNKINRGLVIPACNRQYKQPLLDLDVGFITCFLWQVPSIAVMEI